MGTDNEILERLKATQGDVHAQAAVMADFLLSAYADDERVPLRDGLDAAAVLHWFDPGLLHQVLDIPVQEAESRFEQLKTLSFVEPYGSGDSGRCNVHEATRLGWRKLLANDRPERFQTLSAKAVACFADDLRPAGRIEWIYHLLCGDPEQGATALEGLGRAWGDTARPEDESALAAALGELEATGLVTGRARARTLLAIAWNRISRGASAQLGHRTSEALRLASEVGDERAVSDAQCLIGDVLEAQGKLEAAQKAYGEYLTTSRRLAEQDPNNVGWQRDLAAAHSRVGGVLEAQGKLEAAQAAFGEFLAIFRRLAEQDPSNAGWQRGLALACLRLARLEVAGSRRDTALPLYEESFRIFNTLVEAVPGIPQWAEDRAIVESELASCRSRGSTPK